MTQDKPETEASHANKAVPGSPGAAGQDGHGAAVPGGQGAVGQDARGAVGPELYPLGLRLEGRTVLVVGGGSVATRRIPALLAAGAVVRLVSPVLTPSLRGLADAGRVTWSPRVFQPGDLDDVWLIQVAVDDSGAAIEISRLAQERRIFCVRADDRHAATAWTPAVTRHGPVTVAVLAGGAPRRAAALRDQLAELLASGAIREAGAAGGPISSAGSADGLAGSAGPAGVLSGGGSAGGPISPVGSAGVQGGGSGGGPISSAGSAGVQGGGGPTSGPISSAGSAGDLGTRMGSVALVGGGPGDPGLITVTGRRLLSAADVVVADRLGPGLLLDELRPEVELIDVAKLPYGQAVQQEEINRILIDRARQGRFVVRLKGGDPFVFGRGGEEVLACAAAGVPVTVVPGVTSAIAVPAMAGIPVSHRGVTHEFTVVSGHLAPGDPGSLVNWPALAQLRGTLVVLMGLRHLKSIVDTLIAHGRDPDTPAAIIQDGTTSNQNAVIATLATLPQGLRPPAIVVIGDVVSALTSP